MDRRGHMGCKGQPHSQNTRGRVHLQLDHSTPGKGSVMLAQPRPGGRSTQWTWKTQQQSIPVSLWTLPRTQLKLS
jgi:hypothetical protein